MPFWVLKRWISRRHFGLGIHWSREVKLGDGTGVRRSPARRQIPRHRTGDERQDERPRIVHRPRHAESVARIHAGPIRQSGAYYFWISRDIDNREVRADRIRKSVGAENTFSTDLTGFETMVSELQPLIDKVWRHCEDKGARGRTVTLKVKFNDFEIITRSRSAPVAISNRNDLERISVALLQAEIPFPKPVRLLGVSRRYRATNRQNRNSVYRSEEAADSTSNEQGDHVISGPVSKRGAG
jgi:hypothetical protein